jgi:spore maturation protein CgeB
LDVVIHFYPFPRSRFVVGACNVWWFQAPLGPEADRLSDILPFYDGCLAAGPRLAEHLLQCGARHVLFLPMSANPRVHRPVPPDPQYAHPIAFCANPGNRAHEDLVQYLWPLVDYGLALYGAGWEHLPELAPAARGPLHPRYVPTLYSSAQIVLSMHTAWHRDNDVPTSRLWEALACEAFVISDKVPTAQQLFGETIVWTDGGPELAEQVAYYLAHPERRAAKAQAGRQLVSGRYSFDQQARRILDFLASLNVSLKINFSKH